MSFNNLRNFISTHNFNAHSILQYETDCEATVLKIDKSLRTDSGKYTITASNQFGKDSADIEVEVVDKPGPPKGPLVYDGLTQESVNLSWSPPLDNGGSDITGYVIEMTEYGVDSWRAIPGFCPKTNFTVKGLHDGKRYVFRVRAENIYGTGEPLEGKPVVAKSPFDAPDAPGTPEITGYTPNSCSLTWTPPTNQGGRPVTGQYKTILALRIVLIMCL